MTYKRGEHPNSLKNLEIGRFQKGKVSNPRGRPRKEICVTTILREQLGQPCSKDPSKTWAQWLALRALELAGENPSYYKELLDRVEGKVEPHTPEQPVTKGLLVIVQDEYTKELVERAGERTRCLKQGNDIEMEVDDYAIQER